MKSIAFLDDNNPVRTMFSDMSDARHYENWRNRTVRRSVLENYLKVDIKNAFYGNETHSGNIFVITDENTEGETVYTDETFAVGEPGGYDSLVTSLKEVLICVWTADCIPIYLYDPVKQVIAITHNGWRGICSRITNNTIQVMENLFGTVPENIQAALGPGICGKCYEVGEDICQLFEKRYKQEIVRELFTDRGNGKFLMDLKKAVSLELAAAGVLPDHIFDTGICSYEDKNYASYRRDGESGPAMQTLSGIVMV